ncbi:MAG: type II toxin-antitoxin system RelE/ParE family toxin [Phycisphaerales bacterium]|jgi:toxin ParE1/3/4|nr:type II toxin-antitoxin system RelE/ParE family toxin [Phycisphaerales bacterium]
MRLRLSHRADADLDAIWTYIAKDNPKAADRVERDLHTTMQMLSEHPGIGHIRPDVPRPGYRFWRIYSFLIVYRIEADDLIVVRVLHGSRDIRQHLRLGS